MLLEVNKLFTRKQKMYPNYNNNYTHCLMLYLILYN